MLSPSDPGLQSISQDMELVTKDEHVRLCPCAFVDFLGSSMAGIPISEERHILGFSILTLFT